MIILKLKLAVVGEQVVFAGRDEYSEGFKLEMPASEYKALGSPAEVEFVCSAQKLSVGSQGDVREAS